MPMACERGLDAGPVGADCDRGSGGVRLLVVVLNQIMFVSN